MYINEGRRQFRDATLESGLAVETRYVGRGASFADFDNDGAPDLLVVTGHLYPELRLSGLPYRTPPLLFRNLGAARFEQIDLKLGTVNSSRGSRVADFDNDGDLDSAVRNRNEVPSLLRNDLAAKRAWIQLEAPLHTRVTVRRFAQEVVSQSSFHSTPGRMLYFGLGTSAAVTVDAAARFAGGTTRVLRGLAIKRRHRIQQ